MENQMETNVHLAVGVVRHLTTEHQASCSSDKVMKRMVHRVVCISTDVLRPFLSLPCHLKPPPPPPHA